MGTKTYFSADDGQSGEELWVSDGTEEGTFLLADINAGSKDSSPRSITEADGAIYFSAKTDRYGRELWRLGQPKTNKTRTATRNSSRGQDIDLTRLVYDTPGKGRLRGKRNTSDEFIFSRNNQFGPKKADHIIGFAAQEGDILQLNAAAFLVSNGNASRSSTAYEALIVSWNNRVQSSISNPSGNSISIGTDASQAWGIPRIQACSPFSRGLQTSRRQTLA